MKKETEPKKQFGCSCGKRYRSYCAAYTHIINKHPISEKEERMRTIKQPYPHRSKGRPTFLGIPFPSDQIEEIDVGDCFLLEAYKLISFKYPQRSIILSGDEQQSEEKVLEEYQRILECGESITEVIQLADFEENFEDSLPHKNQETNPLKQMVPILNHFYQLITKHFQPQIAARILWTLSQSTVVENTISYSAEIKHKMQTIWYLVEEMGDLIIVYFTKWIKVFQQKNSGEPHCSAKTSDSGL